MAKIKVTCVGSEPVAVIICRRSEHAEHYRIIDVLRRDEFGVYLIDSNEHLVVVELEISSSVADIKWDKDRLIFRNLAAVRRFRQRIGRVSD
jgi:hypothetical protein